MFKKKIKVKFFNSSTYPCYELKKIKIGDWIDLRAAEDVYLKKGNFICTLKIQKICLKL